MGTVRSGLPAETWCICCVLNREITFFHDGIAVQVGDGHLRRGNEVQVIDAYVVHLPFLIGELAGTEAGRLIDQYGGLHFPITGLCSLVEEEVDHSTLQPCPLALIYGESGPRNFVA